MEIQKVAGNVLAYPEVYVIVVGVAPIVDEVEPVVVGMAVVEDTTEVTRPFPTIAKIACCTAARPAVARAESLPKM